MGILLGFLIGVGLVSIWIAGHYDFEKDTSYGLLFIAITLLLIIIALIYTNIQ